MLEENPYATPQATLETEQQQFYQPQFMAWNGRIGRIRYLAYSFWTHILLLIIPFTGGVIDGMLQLNQSFISSIASIIYYLGLLVVYMIYGKRRLNDLDKSGWWILLIVIPFVNLILIIYLVFFPGNEGENNYGLPSIKNSLGLTIAGLIVPVFFIVGILAAIVIPTYVTYVEKTQKAQLIQD